MTKVQRYANEIRMLKSYVRETRSNKALPKTVKDQNIRSTIAAIRHRQELMAAAKRAAKK